MKLIRLINTFIILMISLCSQVQGQSSIQTCLEAFTSPHLLTVNAQSFPILTRKEFNYFNQSLVEHNTDFINLVKNTDYEGKVFFRLENRYMKELNDIVLKNKSFSYSSSISFQTLFLNELKSYSPKDFSKIQFKYHDYKSLNLAFDESVNLDVIQIAYERSRERFAVLIKKDLAKNNITIPTQYQNFDNWHLASVAKNPDEASLIAKLGRNTNSAKLIQTSDQINNIQQTIKTKNKSWKHIQENFSDPRLFGEHLINGKKVTTLSLELTDMVRKSTGQEEFLDAFINIYGKYNVKYITDIYDYVKSIDSLSASVLTKNSMALGLSKTSGIVYSVDIAKMGSEGLIETMIRINGLESVDDIITQSRSAFWAADSKLQSYYKNIYDAFSSEFDPTIIKYGFKTSGDDTIFDLALAIESSKEELRLIKKVLGPTHAEVIKLNQRVTQFQKKWGQYRESGFDNYIRRLAELDISSRFRVTSVRPNYLGSSNAINRSKVIEYIEKGESAEKYIRKFLKQQQIPDSQITLGIEFSAMSADRFQHRIVIVNKSSNSSQMLEGQIKIAYNDFLRINKLQSEFITPRFDIY